VRNVGETILVAFLRLTQEDIQAVQVFTLMENRFILEQIP